MLIPPLSQDPEELVPVQGDSPDSGDPLPPGYLSSSLISENTQPQRKINAVKNLMRT